MSTSINETESLNRYLTEINRFPVLTRAQEKEVAERFRETKATSDAHKLVASNLKFVVKIAHEYKGYGLGVLDLIQEGNVGLMMAVKKFDPDKGYRLISYAVWWIRAYIQNFVMSSWSLVKIGTTQAQRKLFFKLRSAREQADRLAGSGGRASAKKIADSLGVNEPEVSTMELRLGARDFSLDMDVVEDARTTHLDRVADQSKDQEELVAENERDQLARDMVRKLMATLSERERFLITNRLMADEPLTLQEIGKRFHVSRERARQIQSSLVLKLRKTMVTQGLQPMAA